MANGSNEDQNNNSQQQTEKPQGNNNQQQSQEPEGGTGQQTSQPGGASTDRLQTLHGELLKVQANSDMEGVPEDYEQFNSWFQDPEYRKEFHSFLMDQQQQGRFGQIPEDFNRFEGVLTGKIEPGSEEDQGPYTGMSLPKELRQLDLDVRQVVETAFGSTRDMDQYDSLDRYNQTQQQKAGEAMNRLAGGAQPQRSPMEWTGSAYGVDDQAQAEKSEDQAMAELQLDEMKQDLKKGKYSQSQFQDDVENNWWESAAKTFAQQTSQSTEQLGKGLVRFFVSQGPSLMAEFMGEFYHDPLDGPIGGPSETTKKMRQDWKDIADWFESLGENELIAIDQNLKGKGLEDVIDNPGLFMPWLAAKTGETAPSMIPGIAAMKVLKPVTTAGQVLAATSGAAPIELGAQLKDLRKTTEREGREATDWEKALAIGSGSAAAVFEGIADRYIFKFVSDAMKGSGLAKGVRNKIMKETGESLARRFATIGINSGKQAGIESMTEVVQETLANVGARYGWDPDRNIFENVPEAAVVGAAVGGGTTFTFSSAAEVMRDKDSHLALTEGQLQEDLGPMQQVSFTVPTEGSITDQYNAVEQERQRLQKEKIQAEQEGRPTIDHDMALSRLSIIGSNIQQEIQNNREEAIDLKVKKTERGPEFQQTEEARQRRGEAFGQALTGQQPEQPTGQSAEQVEVQPTGQQPGMAQPVVEPEGPRVDVTGQEFISPEEFQQMSPEEQQAYQEPITTEIEQPTGETTEIDSGLAPFARSATSMGYEIVSGDSGMQADHPGARDQEGQVQSRGGQGNIVFAERNQPDKRANIKGAAQEAGLNVSEEGAPMRQAGIKVSLPYTRDGSSQQQMFREAAQRTDARNPDLRDNNFELWQRRRDQILQEEVIPEHGGVKEYTDQEVANYWEAFSQQLEQSEGFAPDQRTSYQIDEDVSPDQQIQQISEETARIIRNRDIAERRGQSTEQFDQTIQQLQQRRNEIRNRQMQQARQDLAQEGTIEEAMGQEVTMGEYSGTLTQDQEGNIVIETGDGQVVEVPDTFKDTSTPLSETEVVRTPGVQRTMTMTDAESGRFLLDERDALLDVVQRQEEFTYLESNRNDAGEVVSVTMADESGNRKIFRDPDLVEQVIWQQYFGDPEQTEIDTQEFEQAVDQAIEQQQEQGQDPEFQLDDGDPRINVVFDKFETGQPLTESEQIRALDWIEEKTQQLQQSGVKNAPTLFNYLIAFENEVIENNPQETPDSPQQEDTDADQGEVPGSPTETADQDTGPAQQQLGSEGQQLQQDVLAGDFIPSTDLASTNDRLTAISEESGIEITPGMTEQQFVNELLTSPVSETEGPIELSQNANKLIRDFRSGKSMPEMVMLPAKSGPTWQEQVALDHGIQPTEDMTVEELVNELLERSGQEGIEVSPHRAQPEEYIQNRIDELPEEIQMDEEHLTHLINNEFIPDHKQAVAQALEDNKAVPEGVLAAYPDLLNETQKDPDNSEIPAEQTPRRHVETMTKEKFRQQLQDKTDITEDQVEGIIELISQRAKVWAKQNGRNESEYWKRRLAGIDNRPPISEDQANEVIESYGDDVNSMEDVDGKLREKTEVSYSENGNWVQLPDGRIMEYQSAKQLGFFDDVPGRPAPEEDPITAMHGQREFQQDPDVEFTMQERQYIPWDGIKPMSRNQQVRSATDVAFMFSELENSAIEQAYIVGVDSNGEATVLNVGLGAPSFSSIDHTAIVDFVQRFDIQEVTMVHNHPSGTLKPSTADKRMHSRLSNRLPPGVRMKDSIIINRDSGLFGVFNNARSKGQQEVPITAAREESLEGPYATTSREVPVFSYGRYKNTKNYAAPGQRPEVTSPSSIAEFVETRRFTLTDKFSAVLLNNAKEVIGFVHMKNRPQLGKKSTAVGRGPFATELRNYIDRAGARSAVLVTNQSPDDFRIHKGYFQELAKGFDKSADILDDVITVSPGANSRRNHESLRTSGVLETPAQYRAHREPVELYGNTAEEGTVSFDTDERAIIHLFENENDFETLVRQIGKIFRRDLTPDQLGTMEAWLGVQDGNWTAEQEEAFATRFTKYLADGKAPNQEVKSLFDKFKEWLQNVYQSLTQQDNAVIITADQRRVFDSLFENPDADFRNSDNAFRQTGSDIEVSFKPDGSENVQGKYAVIEARDLQPSHNTDGSLNSKHVISKGQPRDRRGRKYIAQHKEIAQKLNPQAITGNDIAFYGAPTTNMRGEVIQGNGRSISIQIAYSENPGRAQNYKGYLITHADEFGLDNTEIAQMDRPVLVRALDVGDREAVRLGNIQNTAEAQMDPIDQAKASVRNLPDRQRQRIGRIMEGSSAETIRSILDDVGPEIIDLLPDVSRTEYLNENNDITVKGKDFMADVFRSLVFDSATGRDTVRKFSDMPHDIIRGIERSYGTLIRYLGTPADLSTTLQNAVDIVWHVRRNKNMNTASDFVNQQDVFAQSQDAYTDQEVQLAQVLLDVQRPSSQLMKDLGTTGTQRAIRTLIKQYANHVDGETNLFSQGQTPDDAQLSPEQAFEEAFVADQPQQQEGGGPGQQPGTTGDRSRGPTVSYTESMHSRNSGIDNIRDLEPQGETNTDWLAEENIKSKDAKKLAKKFRKDPDGNEVGMRSIVNFFNDQIGVEMRIGKENTTRRHPAVYWHPARLQRTRTPLDVAVFHEGGHGIHRRIQQDRPDFLEQFNWPEFMNHLEDAGISRASADANTEYFAEWVRAYIMNPDFTSSLDVTNQIEQVLEREAPDLFNALQDASRLYNLHSDRGTVAMTRAASKDVGPAPEGWRKTARNVFDRFTFTALGRNWAVHQWERDAVFKAFERVYDTNKEAQERAREFMKDIRETKADFRLAHQITNRISGVVRDAFQGTGLNIMSTGDGVLATQDQIEQLREAGIDISDQLAARLTDPAGTHGQKIMLHDTPIQDTLEKIGADAWPQFEWYAQYKVSLERLIRKQQPYPAITEKKPSEVANKIQEFERAYPEWKQYFRELNDYMDKLLLTGFLGGDKSLEEVTTMASSYEFYMPLMKNLEGGSSIRSAGTGIPSADAGFRGLTGEGDHPFMPLLKAIEQRTYQVVDAYYQNRAMLAPVYMAEELNSRDDIPPEAKVPINRLISPIQIDQKKVADLKPDEMAEVIADYLNQQNREEVAAEMGVDPSELISENEITKEDINIASPSKPIWRGAAPQGVNIIAVKRDGELQYFQLKNPHMYDYFARTDDAGGAAKFWNNVAKATAPWKKSITNTIDFMVRNIGRDATTAAYYGLPPEYTVDEQGVTDFLKSVIPGYYLAKGAHAKATRGLLNKVRDNKAMEKLLGPGYEFTVGILEQITPKNAAEIVDTELLSRSMQDAMSEQRRANQGRFKEVLKEGLFPENWSSMDWKERTFHVMFVAPNVLLNKPFHLFMEGTGMSKAANVSEESPRVGAYLHMKEQGHSDEAAMLAYDFVSGNFGERPGNANIHAAYRAGGFVNPTTQIFSETLRRFVNPDSRIQWQQGLRLGMGVAVPTALVWAISTMVTGEDRMEELEERTNDERSNYMPLFGKYRIPFDYGPTGAIQSFMWLSLDKMANDSDLPNDEFAKTVMKRMLSTPIPLDSPAGSLSSIMQMAMGPQLTSVAEGIFNKKLYWNEPIVPPFLTQYPPEQQAYTTTPGFYKTLGELSGISPLKVQHVLNNSTGYLMGRTLAFKDKIAKGEPLKAVDYPIGGKVIQRTPKGWFTQSAQKVSELDQRYHNLNREVKQLREANTGDPDDIQRMRELQNEMTKLGHFNETAKTLDKIYKQVKQLREQGQWERAEILEKQMTEIAAGALSSAGTLKID